MAIYEDIQHLFFNFLFLQLAAGNYIILALRHRRYMFEGKTAIRTVSDSRSTFLGCSAVDSTVVLNLSLLLLLNFLAHVFELFLFKYLRACTLRSFSGDAALRFTAFQCCSG